MGKRIYIYCFTLIPALIFAGVILLYSPYYFKPKYTQGVMNEAQKASEKIARHLIAEHKIDIEQYNSFQYDEFQGCIANDIRCFNLWKVRLFNSDGIIVFSSKKKEEGNVNHKPYFTQIVAKGNVFSKIVKKRDFTASGSITPFDVVETYVPIMEKGKFTGAYEIYLNVTDQMNSIEELFWRTYIVSIIVVTLFVMLVIFSSVAIDRSVKKLQMAREEIKTLQGILPICSSCKKIRDEKGFWKRVFSYISDHTDAKFSHGMCGECMKELYPERDSEES